MEAQSYPEDIDFGKYWLILKRRWVPAGSVFVCVLLLTAIVASLQKPGYEASGKILFRKRDTTAALLTEGAGKVGELELLSQQNTPIDTEAEVLRSLSFLNFFSIFSIYNKAKLYLIFPKGKYSSYFYILFTEQEQRA
jgi:uncharacterized protein involved in exopolysaccharide biosynthesis